MRSENFKAEVISLGRVTIPKTIRDILSISDGDYVEITIKKIEHSSLLNQEQILEVSQIEKT